MTVTLDRPLLATAEWPDGRVPVEAAFLAVAAAHLGQPAAAGPDGVPDRGELDDRSARVAGLLALLGIRPGQAVGVFLPPSADLPVTVLGILRAGAVYLPFEPGQPTLRLAAIAEDSGVELVLSHSSVLSAFPPAAGTALLAVDAVDWAAVAPAAPVAVPPQHPAYLVFGSGPTGRPEPVRMSHGALAARLAGPARTPAGPVPERRPGSGVRVLDEWLAEVPDGEVGELFVTGVRSATGYAGRPGLAASRFVPDPYTADGSRMYRTGDRVSRAADGTLVHRGPVGGDRAGLRPVAVLVNEHRRYGLYPAYLPAPAGWWPAGFTGPEELAVGWVDEHWTQGAR